MKFYIPSCQLGILGRYIIFVDVNFIKKEQRNGVSFLTEFYFECNIITLKDIRDRNLFLCVVGTSV